MCTIVSELSYLRLNLGQAINCHPGVSHEGRGIDVCAFLWMDVKPEDLSAGPLSRLIVYIKDPMVSSATSKQLLASTL